MTDQAYPSQERQAFERFPVLAKWLERLARANVEGLSLSDWCQFLDAINQAIEHADDQRVREVSEAHSKAQDIYICATAGRDALEASLSTATEHVRKLLDTEGNGWPGACTDAQRWLTAGTGNCDH